MITITLRALPGVEPTLALRRLLRYALRACGLKCTAIRCDALEFEPTPEERVANVVAHSTDVGTDG